MIEQWSAGWGAAVIGMLLVSLLVLAIFLYRCRQNDERRVAQGISRYAVDHIRAAVIPDGIEGYLFADHLLRMNDRIIVLNMESRKGYIFGAANIDEWTCVEDKRSEIFTNPLKRTSLFVQQSQQITGFESIQGYALFGGGSDFPKGVPEGVVLMTRLEETLASLSGTEEDFSSAETVARAWEGLKQANRDSSLQIDSSL